MSAQFKQAAEALVLANTKFAAGELTPMGHRDARESAMVKALAALAKEFDVQILEPIHVDSRGELKIVAIHPDGRPPSMGCGQFGAFAELLSRNRARMGIAPGHISPENGWCMMNHFDVERMVLGHLHGPQAAPPPAPQPSRPRP